jgi:hypothetical protein
MVATSAVAGGSENPCYPFAPRLDTAAASLEADRGATERGAVSASRLRAVSTKQSFAPIIDRTAKKYGVEPKPSDIGVAVKLDELVPEAKVAFPLKNSLL